jgi:predicted dehydrogenase
MDRAPIRIGIVGVAGRANSFTQSLKALGFSVAAVCDLQAEVREEARVRMEAERAFGDYDRMLKDGGLDAVLIATPMNLHAPQAAAALERGIHVLSEVPAAVSIEQCRQLATAARRSKALYMMAENFNYVRHIQFVDGLVKAGLFGEVYYAEGEYVHEGKELIERSPWRRQWAVGIRGVTYPTHSLGPILMWMDHDRIKQVSCADSGSHYHDAHGRAYAGDSFVMLARTDAGRLIKIRCDMVSNRPHVNYNTHLLQGTEGCFESNRGGAGESHRIWLKSVSRDLDRWLSMDSLMEQQAFQRYLPDLWRHQPEALVQAGHGGGDYYIIDRFARAIRGEIANPIDVHRALDMTLPALISQEAVAGDRWLEVPDSRQWE